MIYGPTPKQIDAANLREVRFFQGLTLDRGVWNYTGRNCIPAGERLTGIVLGPSGQAPELGMEPKVTAVSQRQYERTDLHAVGLFKGHLCGFLSFYGDRQATDFLIKAYHSLAERAHADVKHMFEHHELHLLVREHFEDGGTPGYTLTEYIKNGNDGAHTVVDVTKDGDGWRVGTKTKKEGRVHQGGVGVVLRKDMPEQEVLENARLLARSLFAGFSIDYIPEVLLWGEPVKE